MILIPRSIIFSTLFYTQQSNAFFVSSPTIHGHSNEMPLTQDFSRSSSRTSSLHSSLGQHAINGEGEIKQIGMDYTIHDSYNLVVLGDLHMEDDMTQHEQARQDCITALEDLSLLPCQTQAQVQDQTSKDANPNKDPITVQSLLQSIQNTPAKDLTQSQLEMLLQQSKYGPLMKSHLVSLGDLGRKDIRHQPGDAGTTKSFVDAKGFLDGFGLPFDLVTGNHDLEGLDEFTTDKDNLQAWMDCFNKDKPYFCTQVGERTLLVGLSTIRFRNAPYSSHECYADPEQLTWFQEIVESHPHSEGWKICVFSHAPIMGSGLRVLQNVHVVNGCAWMNHCDESRGFFHEMVMKHPQIKLWFSGHFHLSHDYQDSISRVNQCTFVQVGVIGPVSTRDQRRQTRIIQGNDEVMNIYTVNHHKRNDDGKAELRLDATIDLNNGEMDLAHGSKDYDHDNWFSAYVPQEQDGCYLATPEGKVVCQQSETNKICWWHMADGAVLGVHEDQLVEYDASTLSPLGIVVNQKQLNGREVLVVEEGKAIVLIDPKTNDAEVVHPNDDGSYWRKYQRNKRVRQEEKAREAAVKEWLSKSRPSE